MIHRRQPGRRTAGHQHPPRFAVQTGAFGNTGGEQRPQFARRHFAPDRCAATDRCNLQYGVRDAFRQRGTSAIAAARHHGTDRCQRAAFVLQQRPTGAHQYAARQHGDDALLRRGAFGNDAQLCFAVAERQIFDAVDQPGQCRSAQAGGDAGKNNGAKQRQVFECHEWLSL